MIVLVLVLVLVVVGCWLVVGGVGTNVMHGNGRKRHERKSIGAAATDVAAAPFMVVLVEVGTPHG